MQRILINPQVAHLNWLAKDKYVCSKPLKYTDSTTWKLAVSEHDIRTFPRPLWFPHDGYTGMSGERQTLGNPGGVFGGAKLVAVSAPALSDIWYRPVEYVRGLSL